MKTHFKKLQNPNYLGSWDLVKEDDTFGELTVTIAGVTKENVHDGKGGTELCNVLKLAGCKPMVLNSTNMKAIAKAVKSNFVEDWPGCQIRIKVEKVKAFGEVHDALRIDPRAVQKELLTKDHPLWQQIHAALSATPPTRTPEQIAAKFSVSAQLMAELTEVYNQANQPTQTQQ